MNSSLDPLGNSFTILGIATVTIGFGLFRADFRVDDFLLQPGFGPFLAGIKLFFGLSAIFWYVLLLLSVAKTFATTENVTGQQAAQGALVRLYIV